MKTVAVIGAGNSGLASAAWLAHHGVPVHLWNRSEETIATLCETRGITCHGALEATVTIPLVTTDIEAALAGAGLVMVTTPADSHPGLAERMGTEPVNLSPYHQVKKGAPPAIVFHGTADSTVPFKTAELFAEKSKKLGNRCKLVGAEGQAHGFFNFGRSENKHFLATVRAMDEFLADLGWLEGEPTVEKWVEDL